MRYSGRYGDLGATVAAILLDREARADTLDSDKTAGMLREPLLRVIHFMRSLGFSSKEGREVELSSLFERIGQAHTFSPSVFSFFPPDYSPAGVVADARLTSPEAVLLTAPLMFSMINGLSSLARAGLTTCYEGFGSRVAGTIRGCGTEVSAKASSDGNVTFTPLSADADAAISELDLLLTGGRLNSNTKAVIRSAYLSKLAQSPASAISVCLSGFLGSECG
jgi:cullin-associated NEDD8-dissociated protein 1